MDAEPEITVNVERIVEAFSGLPLIRVTGWWDQPGDTAVSLPDLEIHYDGCVANHCHVAAEGEHRVNFGTQLPVEPGVNWLEVVALGPPKRILYRQSIYAIENQPCVATPRHGFLRRALQSVVSGEVFSPWRWRARWSRLSEQLLVLRQKVRNKLRSRQFPPRDAHTAYVEHTTLTPRLRQAMLGEIASFQTCPKFSILVPVYNVDPRWLREAIASVQRQVYPHWELCLADDCSTRSDLVQYLNTLPSDPRIKLVRREANGHICQATNSAADLASGDFIALLDNDDALAPHALFAIAQHLQSHPDADLIYSDEDKIDEFGRRYDPQFKPDWSPELLLSYNYINHFTVIRRSLFERVGRFRPGYEGSQDHDLLLRVTELTHHVHHVPEILYHWRALPQSTASSAGVKPIVHTSGRRAVEDALTRRGITASLYVPPFAQKLNLPVLGLDGDDVGPSVGVLIVGNENAIQRTARHLTTTTTYRHFRSHHVIVDTPSADALNHHASTRPEELILIMEAGLEPANPRWLSRLVANLMIPGVGAVGGVIRDAAGGVEDAGPILGLHDGTAPDRAFSGLPSGAISYYFYAEVTRNTAAVSGRCLLIRRSVFEQLGGFDARHFPHSLWDVDFGMRLRDRGFRCVTVGGCELIGSGSRPPVTPSERLAFKQRYGRTRDPFHNPNCSEHSAWQPRCDSPLSLLAEAITPPVRALVVAHNLNNPEGAPRYLSEIVLGMRDRNAIHPVVFSPLGGAGEHVYTQAAVPVVVCQTEDSRRFVDGLWTPREYERIQRVAIRLLRDQRPDVVVANTLTTFPLVEAAATVGIPCVWIIHESYSRDHLERLFPPYAQHRIRAAFAMAARVIPASHDTAALFAHLNTRGNICVIHNGLDPKPFDTYLRDNSRSEALRRIGGDSTKRHVIAVGTICERKGQHTLIEAAKILARDRDDFIVHLVGMRGGIPYGDYARHLIARHGLESVVHLVPETDAVWNYYRAADVFVCTSAMETFSRAVLEAEAFGLPILSTACCGLSEQVVWGSNALPFAFGDATGLAQQLRRVLDEHRLRQRMAMESRAMFDVHLNQQEMLDRYSHVILAAARQGPRAQQSLPILTRSPRRAA